MLIDGMDFDKNRRSYRAPRPRALIWIILALATAIELVYLAFRSL